LRSVRSPGASASTIGLVSDSAIEALPAAVAPRPPGRSRKALPHNGYGFSYEKEWEVKTREQQRIAGRNETLLDCAAGPTVHRGVRELVQATIRKLQTLDDTGYSGHISLVLGLLELQALLDRLREGIENSALALYFILAGDTTETSIRIKHRQAFPRKKRVIEPPSGLNEMPSWLDGGNMIRCPCVELDGLPPDADARSGSLLRVGSVSRVPCANHFFGISPNVLIRIKSGGGFYYR